jgi:hypothetical protein|nr:hypothetical protein [Kofleriaceae bacterium]
MSPRPAVFVLHSSMVALIGAAVAASACGGDGNTCVHDTDCASQFCRADGTCGPADGADGGGGGSGIDASPGGDGATGACTPNHDGSISRDEEPLAAGRAAVFRTAANATISTAGSANPDGSRTWDLSAALSGDQDDTVTLASPAGAWWQSDFGSATYAVTLSSSSDLLGVFEVSDSAVLLLGVVSPDSGGGTDLAYDPPARIVQLPFKAGDTWTSTSTVSGTATGVGTLYTEKYSSLVDEVGTMTTPYGAFPVLRVATDLTRTEGVTELATSRTFTWNAECFGAVATAVSQDFETGAEFTSAAEVERLAP